MKNNPGLFSKNGKTTFVLVMVSLLSLLSGCTSNKSSLSYYLLHSAVSSEHSEGNSQLSSQGIALFIKKVTLPDYLKHRGLVYQLSETNLHISTTHLWAEPFEEGLRKTLRSQLARDNVYLVSAKNELGEGVVELSLNISDFVSTFRGNIVLNGDVVASRGSEKTRYPFFIETKIEEDGFSASVIAMRKALAVLATQISERTNVQ